MHTVWPTASSPPLNETHGNDMMSMFYPAYEPGPDSTRTAFDSHRTLSRSSSTSDRYLPVPVIEQEICDLGHHLDDPSAYQSLSSSSHTTCSHYPSVPNDRNVADTFTPHHLPSHQFTIPSSPSHPTSAGYLQPHPGLRLVSPEDATGSSRRERGAHAIEYRGLLVDEEELRKGLTETNGKLNVHQCHWEEDRTPCHLWIKGDKSSINVHIQMWHGGKPGGVKHEADCRWSTCGKTMLKESIGRHIVRLHLGEMWECQGCGKGTTRSDTYGRHVVRSNFEACRSAGALVTYSADVRVIDVRAALDSGRRLDYTDE